MKVWFFRRASIKIFCLLLLGLSVAVWGIFSWWQQSSSVMGPIYQGVNDKKAVAFAVNVDWGEDIVPQMLEIFSKEKIKGTFFVTGRFAEKFPQVIKEIEKAGHEIGNHGFSHGHPDQMGFGENQQQITRTEEVLIKSGLKPVKLFAPPYGECSPPVVEAAGKLGYKTIMWTVDTVDWKGGSGQQIAEKIIANAQNGAIILMHPTKVTIEALPIMIGELKKQGYKFEKISQIIPGGKSQNN